MAASRNRRCNVITLRLALLYLELLGVQVQTSYISLDVYALRGRVLGHLFCALAHAKVSFPKVARDLNSRLGGRSMQVLGAADSLPAHSAQAQPASCQVLKLVLGPLHLDLLGQLLCGLAGGTGVNSLGGLQSLLSLLNQLGISNLSAGLTELDLNRILAGLRARVDDAVRLSGVEIAAPTLEDVFIDLTGRTLR